jgi:hypothetical protein
MVILDGNNMVQICNMPYLSSGTTGHIVCCIPAMRAVANTRLLFCEWLLNDAILRHLLPRTRYTKKCRHFDKKNQFIINVARSMLFIIQATCKGDEKTIHI